MGYEQVVECSILGGECRLFIKKEGNNEGPCHPRDEAERKYRGKGDGENRQRPA